MSHVYTEDQLVEQPAIGLFADLEWETVSAAEETFGASGTLGRMAKNEAVLAGRLRAALEKLNPTLPPEAITAAMDELTRNRSAMSIVAANREFHTLLKEGVRVKVADSPPQPPLPLREGAGGEGSRRRNGGQRIERVRVIDWQKPAAMCLFTPIAIFTSR